MRAIQQHRYGTSTMLTLAEVDQLTPGQGEVVVRVIAAGVNMADWHLMTGEPWLMRLALGLRGPRQKIRGSDVAGVVETVGPGVTDFAVGDEIFGTARGSFADFAVARGADLALKPQSVSFAEAAASVLAGYTALRAVRDTAKVHPGQRVLVLGAGGGVGSHAVQIAVAGGADVTGVCSTSKLEFVRGLGASTVIDYTSEEVTGTYDVIIDTGGNRPIGVLRNHLTRAGVAVLVGGEGGNRFLGPVVRSLAAAVASRRQGQRFVTLLATQRAGDIQTLASMLESGALRVPMIHTFPLEETAAVVDSLAAGEVVGKAVISVTPTG